MSKVSVRFDVVVHREDDGSYWGEVPDLPGCFSQGETRNELMKNMREAIACHVGVVDRSIKTETNSKPAKTTKPANPGASTTPPIKTYGIKKKRTDR